MKGPLAFLSVAGLLVLTLLLLAPHTTAADTHSVFAFFPDEVYQLGSLVPVNITVFENGELRDPDQLNLSVEQFDGSRRLVELIRVGVGRYTGDIIVQMSDIDRYGTLWFAATARFGTEYGSDLRYVHTVYESVPKVDVVKTDPDDITFRPGQDVEFDLKVTFLGEPVDPDPGTLSVFAVENYTTGSDWYTYIPVTRVSVGRFNGTFNIPFRGNGSTEYCIDARLNCTVEGRTWPGQVLNGEGMAIPINYFGVWAHTENVTRESTDLTLYIDDRRGSPLGDARVHLTYEYYRDYPLRRRTVSMNATTNEQGIVRFNLSYPDIRQYSDWFNVEGHIDAVGYRQYFWGQVHLPPRPSDYPYNYGGLRVSIMTEDPLPAEEETPISLLVTLDGVPLPGREVFVYMVTSTEVLISGAMVSDLGGFINFTVETGREYINMIYTYWNEYLDEPKFVDRNHWFHVEGSERAFNLYFLDAETIVTAEPYPPGGPVEVTVDNPDADGVAEMAWLIWAEGDAYDYLDNEFHSSWARWHPYDYQYLPLPGNYVIAVWDGECYRATIDLPPFLPDDVEIFVMGLIEFKDSPYQDIRAGILEGLTATLPHARPVVNVTCPVEGGYYQGTVEVAGTATAVTSVRQVYVRPRGEDWYLVDGTTEWNLTLVSGIRSRDLMSGENTIQVKAWDGDLWSKIVTVTFLVDASPRVWIDLPDPSPWFGGVATVPGHAEDDHGVQRVEARLDGGEWTTVQGTTEWTLDVDTRTLERGRHRLEARAFDGHTYSEVAFVLLRVDQPPVLFITSPSEGDVITAPSRAEGIADDDGGAPSVELRIDGGPWTTVEDAGTWVLDLDPDALGSGWHLLEARAYDGIHRSPVVSVNFTVDLPPALGILSPRHGARVPGPVVVTGWAEDDAGVEMVSVRVDGGEWLKAEGSTEWSLALDPGSGEHTVEARAFDGLSHSEVSWATFVLDARPVVDILWPGDGDVLGRRVVVEVAAVDDLDNVTGVQVRVDGGEWMDAEDDGGWRLELVLGEGEHVVEARCSDGFQHSVVEAVGFSVEVKEVTGVGWWPVAALLVLVAVVLVGYAWYRSREQGPGSPD